MNKDLKSANVYYLFEIYWHRASLLEGPKYLDLICFCTNFVISIMHLHIHLSFSMKLTKLSVLNINQPETSSVCAVHA